jgi:Ca-activated chloride channel family protein
VGPGRIVEAKCLAEHNGGLYLTPETEDDLAAALEKTLGCPMVSQYGNITQSESAPDTKPGG